MLQKRADFKLGKSYKDNGSGKKATRAPKTINELLDDNELSLSKNKATPEDPTTDIPGDA